MSPRSIRALVAFVLATSLSPASAGVGETVDGWSIVATPNSPPVDTRNTTSAVSCPAADTCFAVGSFDRGGISQNLILRSDETGWSPMASPNSDPAQSNSLRDVHCLSVSSCWAVGTYDDGTAGRSHALRWDGNGWTSVATPTVSSTQAEWLSGVWCTSSASCWAVGSRQAGSVTQSLIMRWDGSSWTIVASPNSSADQSNYLNGVTCSSATDCWAVGSSTAPGIGERTWAARWDGTAWSLATTPNLGIGHNMLYGVACSSSADCVSVGQATIGSTQQPLAMRWNGSLWTAAIAASGPTSQNTMLRSVDCTSPSSCVAVGHTEPAASPMTSFAVVWDGSGWTTQALPTEPEMNRLAGVDCLGGSCEAVGGVWRSGLEGPRGLRRGPIGWSTVAATGARSERNNTLLGVDCPADDDCWSVASYDAGGWQQTLIQRFDGQAWRIVASPNTSPYQSNILYDIECVTTDDCWAVGYALTAGFQTLTMHWDGSAWTIVPSPNLGVFQNNFLNDIACAAADDCWAVGFYDTGTPGVYRNLMIHWNGSAWTVEAVPNIETSRQNRLYSVACSGQDGCWAVGRHTTDQNFLQTLALRWNGSAWSIVTTPNTSVTESNELSSVACATPTRCFAVGSFSLGSGTGRNLILEWDGASWNQVPAPEPAAPYQYYFLRSVDCADAALCWAVGHYSLAGVTRTMALRFDGSAWNLKATPDTAASQNNYLMGISCRPDASCWASGYHYDSGGVLRTLMLRQRGGNIAPTSRLSVSIPAVAAPVEVVLDASASTDPDDPIVSYRFDPGDGSGSRTSGSPQLTHIYEQPGVYLASVVAIDARGVQGAPSDDVEVRIHGSAPSISQPAEGIWLTHMPATISGTARPGATVVVRDALGALVGSDISDGSGTWSLTAALGEGRHDLTARVIEDGQEGLASAVRWFRVDTIAPAAPAIDTPADGARIGSSLVSVGGRGEPGASVAILLDGAVRAHASVGSLGDWSSTLMVSAGQRRLAAIQTDQAGHTGPPSDERWIEVDPELETATISNPLESSLISAARIEVSGRGAPGASLTISATEGPATGRTWDARVGAGGSWSISIDLGEGSHALTVTDPHGVVSPERRFATSLGKPVITSPRQGQFVAAEVEIEGVGKPGSSVTLKSDGAKLGSGLVGQDGRWSIQARLAEGQRRVEASTSLGSHGLDLMVDASGPTGSIAASSWLMGGPIGSAVSLRGSVWDDISSVGSIRVVYRSQMGGTVIRTPECSGCGTSSVTFEDAPPLTPGLWTATLEATDTVGNPSQPVAASFIVAG